MRHDEFVNNKEALDKYIDANASSGCNWETLFFWRYNNDSVLYDSENKKTYSTKNGLLQELYEDTEQLIFCLDGFNGNRDHFFFIYNPTPYMKKQSYIQEVKC